ncbi:EamA family transporter [Desulforamulus reducens]|uniref:EamA family transporter n=1 Tax=Desulforamulus reducens TaxID=59610 RepID=UPI0002E2B699|nr:EamA family transporter [Desulforamulus reducens]
MTKTYPAMAASLVAIILAYFLNLIPLVSVVAGVVFYGERLSVWQSVGCTAIIVGVWGTNYFSSKGTTREDTVN